MSAPVPAANAPTFGRRGVRTVSPQRADGPVEKRIEAPPRDEGNASDVERFLGLFPLLTIGLVFALMLGFALQRAVAFDVGRGATISPETLHALGAASRDLVLGEYQIWRIALAPVLHASASHILGNCVALALAGFLLEPIIGASWFGLIFVASALAGVAGSLIGNPAATETVGASGAITGVIAALLIMSFHERADPADTAKMRRRALFFGVPALLPLFLGVHDHVDYCAHLGGAIAGGVIALGLAVRWDGDTFRPRGARTAARIGLGAIALVFVACAFPPHQFAMESPVAASLVPAAVLEHTESMTFRRADELVRLYPDDPRARLARAATLLKENHAADAEQALRESMNATWAARPYAEAEVHDLARALLALVVAGKGRLAEARALAAPLCGRLDAPAFVAPFAKAKLCKV